MSISKQFAICLLISGLTVAQHITPTDCDVHSELCANAEKDHAPAVNVPDICTMHPEYDECQSSDSDLEAESNNSHCDWRPEDQCCPDYCKTHQSEDCCWTYKVTKSDEQQKLSINADSRFFVDAYGRTVIFHGQNAIYKVDPYIPNTVEWSPQDSLNETDIANLKDWGTNFVRLGVMWEAVERQPGVYDSAYLDQIEALINQMGEAGIYTLVDAHQDTFARSVCGEGVPDFYAREAAQHPTCINRLVDKVLEPLYKKMGICHDMADFGYRTDENGDPLIEDCLNMGFWMYMGTKQGLDGYSAVYTNKYNLTDKYVAYWDFVASRLASNPYIVGFDPLNEPYAANNIRDPTLDIPGVMDRKHLTPTFSKVFKTWQKHDPSSIMWFESAGDIKTIGGEGVVFPIGYQTPPGGEIGQPNFVVNAHTYCCQMSGGCVDGEPDTSDPEKCLRFHEKRIGVRNRDAQRLGIPAMVTEFGACFTEEACVQEINQVGAVADENLVGWAYWQFKFYADLTTSAGTGSEGFYNADGSLQQWKVKALARAYMPYTQGILTKMNFDTDSAQFQGEFMYDYKVSAPTVLYLNREYWYTQGVNCSVFDLTSNAKVAKKDLTWSWDSSNPNYTSVQVDNEALDKHLLKISCTNEQKI